MSGRFTSYITLAVVALAIALAPATRAQTYIPLVNTSTQQAFIGLSVTISGCQYILNTGGWNTCTSADGLELKQVSIGRGKVELEIVPTSGTAIFSAATGGLTGVQYTLGVTTNLPSSATLTSYALNTTGTNTNGTTNNFFATPSGYTELVASLHQNSSSATCTQGPNGYGSSDPAASCLQSLTPVSSLNFSAGLLIAGATNSGFTLNTATYIFTTAPEPASLFLMASGLAGLAAIRRRRSARRT